jgi:4-amino-4-deoxy-L-arabinose transferase-like glycosyltransferase
MSLLIFVFAFLVRVIIQYLLGSFVHPQTWEYEVAANNLLSGMGLTYNYYGTTYHSLLSPLYPLICAVAYFFTNHSFIAVAIMQAIISSMICVVIFWIGRHLFGGKCGLVAGVMTIFHPGLIIYTAKFHTLVLDSFLFCLVVWLLIAVRKKPVFVNQLKLGLAFGLGMLSRSTIILFLPISWLWLKKGSRQFFLTFLLSSLILFCPWLIRNYTIHKKLMILTSCANFWRGNNPLATGTSFAESGKPMLEEAGNIKSLIKGKSEIEQERIFCNEALRFIRNNPAKFFRLFLKKLFYFWWFAPTTGSEYNRPWLELYRIFYIGLVLFSIIGISKLRGLSSSLQYDALIPILLMAIISISQSFYYVETRHRWAIEPLLLVFAAGGIFFSAAQRGRDLIRRGP